MIFQLTTGNVNGDKAVVDSVLDGAFSYQAFKLLMMSQAAEQIAAYSLQIMDLVIELRNGPMLLTRRQNGLDGFY